MQENRWINNLNKLIGNLLKEYSLDIDDIRWLISSRITKQLLNKKEKPIEITKIIWSGKLEADLYNMEEKYMEDLEFQLERGLIDEAWIRELFAETSELKCRRI
ncbi:MAG: hypothetical protein DRP58_12335 [Spirochaetes bacterium]|nr:MAG: hypothetical protein DRP58_12335 [Spirochaetota bacterium]